MCSNLLTISPLGNDGGNRLECRTCPYQSPITIPIYSHRKIERKEREDLFGGAGAWDNAQKANVRCAREECKGMEAAFYTVQIRSADEPMTEFYKCMTCGHSWRQNG